ncbi:hypothetical protein CMO96_05145 [Candidatus Woesebacteria bacterium]|nr:hypothetical protein [Candidatus Woesebacteria bacterium]
MNTLDHIVNKFGLDATSKSPIEIHNINRTIMVKTLAELGFSVGAEVGVAEGYHAEVLLKNVPGLHLSCIDAWKHYRGYKEYDNLDKMYHETVLKLMPYNTAIYREFSMEAVKKFEDNSLDFVYIDAAHDFVNVAMDICEWSKKVKVGGIVFGHDFKRSKRNIVDVKDVIPAYCYAKNIHPWFILTNDIRDPNFGPDNPGWMFVRQEGDRP